jgi:ATP-dependent exoDNAse (exonuclease V) beta subunit
LHTAHTDPLQIEILWLICGERREGSQGKPLTRTLRPGALFLVGDPKQAIYRFRGADVNAYVDARNAIGGGSLLKITANFRSVEPILAFVNRRFERLLSEAAGQPGFSELSPIRKVSGEAPTVVALDVAIASDKADAAAFRDAEADCVADLCSRLIGNLQVQDHDTSKLRPCRYGDIALLAPVGTELWRFEEALEERGIPVSTQAGKGFFHRQEIQDLIALTRTLADARDTLALGALFRGPLVGLTEAELLDIADGLPPDPDKSDRLPTLSLWTNPAHVIHDTARSVLALLQSLRRRARTTTPYILLADAVAALHVPPQLRQRFKGGPERAIANVDLFLEMARAYGVRGGAGLHGWLYRRGLSAQVRDGDRIRHVADDDCIVNVVVDDVVRRWSHVSRRTHPNRNGPVNRHRQQEDSHRRRGRFQHYEFGRRRCQEEDRRGRWWHEAKYRIVEHEYRPANVNDLLRRRR